MEGYMRSSNGPNGQAIHVLTGLGLRRMLRGKSPRARAEIVARLIRYNVSFTDLSPAQLARLCEANPGAVSVARGNAGTRGPRTGTLDRLLRKYGPDVLMRALDRVTAPQHVAAE
jgi:hypothetical protein